MTRRFISCLLLSLSTMLHLEMPHVNVLSKIDLVRQYGKLGEWGGGGGWGMSRDRLIAMLLLDAKGRSTADRSLTDSPPTLQTST